MQKVPSLLLSAAVLALLSSCASSEMIARAQGRPGPMDPPNYPPLPPQPAYYALVPVVFPFDAVTWPIQYLVMQNNQNAPYNNPRYNPNYPPPPPPRS